jgi:hypothetical protein
VASEEQFQADLANLNVEIEAAQTVGLVQFTEPLRMADVLPGLLLAARRYPGLPLRLVELGACAGLLLAPEAFRINYPRGTWAPPHASADLTCDLDVPPALLTTPLPIADRLGLDLAPVDPCDPGSLDHLRSFTWAGDPERETRLAAGLAAVSRDPPRVMCADVHEALPDILTERVSRDVVTVVLESGLSAYLSGRQALGLGHLLDTRAARGPLVLITRAIPEPGVSDLPNCVKLVDLHQRWRQTYAATDLISERMRWLGGDVKDDAWP